MVVVIGGGEGRGGEGRVGGREKVIKMSSPNIVYQSRQRVWLLIQGGGGGASQPEGNHMM